ncbi:DUF1501 domain-containing protein [Virgisporangium aurantiacum]|uniref:DUF1501 domain-containing protein n=1 Tax=Virgisporangium aurantiacum TaxID=175570 RepID=A0A8J4E0S4_9ACTN|nr:DUF1501 domain-containing protein [Virgisporangium aurantiacum]GIJ58045.1 hypothetical protein Vau01_055610 [Virgisporangium aurantiacum]
MCTRRSLLKTAAAAAAATVVTEGVAARYAFAADSTGDTLVVLSLRGGFDGLSAVIPHGDPDYYKARPTIAVPKAKVIGGDAMFGLHPALAPLLPLWTQGQLAAVHAVGQPNPTRSHFAAMEEMERAAAGTSIRTGWLDRMLGVSTNPWSGVSVGSTKPARALAGPGPDLGIASLDGFTLAGDSASVPMGLTLQALYRDAPAALATPALAATGAVATVAKLPAYTPANGAVYPATPLATALKDVARLIKAGLGLRAACVDFGDWDMHEGLGTAETGQRMHTHLGEFAAALAAFAADLGADGMKNVTLVTLSEFGRRVAENGSRGVDHGHGNAMFVLGGGVRGGKVYGTWPGLAPAKLVAGDLAATTDYRSVIGEVLQKRCGVGSLGTVFPNVTPTTSGLAVARN